MGLAGAASGASRALEEILAERLKAQMLEQAIAERQERFKLDQDRATETRTQNEWERGRADKLDAERSTERTRVADAEATERRGLSNMAGVMSMGLDPQTAKREIAFSARDPRMMIDALTPPKVERDPIADHEARLQLEQKYRPPQRPERDPIADHEAKLRLDAKYKSNSQATDPAKAQETGRKMLDTAKSLRGHAGLSSLTGARIGNPDYALGVTEEPIAGSQAANAAPHFNQLKSLFTLDNIGLLKGVLSDTDMKILASAGTALDTKMQDASFVAELDRVITKLESAFGQPAAGLTPMDPATSRGAVPAPSGNSMYQQYLQRKRGGG